MMELEDSGVIMEAGKKVYLDGMVPYNVDKITEEEYEALENDFTRRSTFEPFKSKTNLSC